MSIYLRLKSLERKARNSGDRAALAFLLQTNVGWQLTINYSGGKQITTTHSTEDEGRAEFEKKVGRCEDSILYVLDV